MRSDVGGGEVSSLQEWQLDVLIGERPSPEARCSWPIDRFTLQASARGIGAAPPTFPPTCRFDLPRGSPDTGAVSPVKQSSARNPRTLLLGLGGVAIGIILVLVLFVVAIPKLTESNTVEVRLGTSTFSAGAAEGRADAIEREGPFLFPDPSGGNRDIYLQHTGTDPLTGWVAFDARRPGTARDCTLSWDHDVGVFRDPCAGDTVPADGSGLVHYTVEVTDDGDVVIDLVTSTGGTTAP